MDRLKNMRKRKEVSPPTSALGARSRSPGFLQLSRPTSPFRRSSPSNPGRSPSAQSPSDSGVVDASSPSSPHIGADGMSPAKALQDGMRKATATKLPAKPAFLRLSDEEILQKFLRINIEDERRARPKPNDPSFNAQWARLHLPETKILDRYANIHPWNYNRIRLQVPEGHVDYINASPIVLQNIKTGNLSKFIAMQGPKANSVNHVWRMIWDSLPDPAVLVMLTVTHEEGLEKCYPYFPQTTEESPLVVNEDDEHKDGFKATIELKEIEREQEGDDLILEIRHMVMTLDADYAASVNAAQTSKSIIHYLYSAWPDFGTPMGKYLRCFFDVMQSSRAHLEEDPEQPRVTHCSAGVGRTGTFIALEFLLNELEAGVLDPSTKTTLAKVRENTSAAPGSYPAVESMYSDDDPNVDIIFATVNALRQQRRYMVQSREQYLFLYHVLEELWTLKYHTHASFDSTDVSPTVLDDQAKDRMSKQSLSRFLRIPARAPWRKKNEQQQQQSGEASDAPARASEDTAASAGEGQPTVWDLARLLAEVEEGAIEEEEELEEDGLEQDIGDGEGEKEVEMTDNESVEINGAPQQAA